MLHHQTASCCARLHLAAPRSSLHPFMIRLDFVCLALFDCCRHRIAAIVLPRLPPPSRRCRTLSGHHHRHMCAYGTVLTHIGTHRLAEGTNCPLHRTCNSRTHVPKRDVSVSHKQRIWSLHLLSGFYISFLRNRIQCSTHLGRKCSEESSPL